jgi:hypothetical protein
MKRSGFLSWLAIVGLVSLVFLVYFQKIDFTAVDLGRHLENGRIVLNDSGVLSRNFYSYTEPEFPFINHHWLYGLTAYIIYLIGGFSGLSLFNLVIAAAAFFLIFCLARKRIGLYPAAILSLPVIILLSERAEIRPEICSYLFIAISYYLLVKVRRDRSYRWLWLFVPLMLIWVNTHIYFFIGLALLAFAGLDDLKFWRRRFWPYLAALAACFLNPNTWRGVLYPFNIFQSYGYEIAENKSIFFLEKMAKDGNFLVFKILLVVLLVSWIIYLYSQRKVRTFDLLVSLFFAGVGLFASRNIAMFGLVFLLVVAGNLEPFKDRLVKLSRPVIFFVLLVISGWLLLYDSCHGRIFIRQEAGWGVSDSYDSSFRFFTDNGLSGPVFNNYDIGSALIFWFDGQEKVFVDNRPEAYSTKFFQDIYKPMQSDLDKWQEAEKKYGFKTIYFSHTDGTPWGGQFLSQIMVDPEWSFVYFDYGSVILSKENRLAGFNLEPSEFASRYQELLAKANRRQALNLASLASLVGYPDLAEQAYLKLISAWPGDGRALAGIAFLYSSSSDYSRLVKSLEYFDEAIDSGYDLPSVINRKGLVLWNLGDHFRAEATWQQALKKDKSDQAALSYLSQAKQFRQQGLIN